MATGITGDFSTWCTNTNRTYSVSATQGATYNWTVNSKLNIVSGQNTNQITLAPGFTGTGTISVTIGSTSACSASATLNATVTTAVGGIGGTIRQTGQTNKDMATTNFIKAGQADVDLYLPGTTTIGCTRTTGTGQWSYNSSTRILTLNFTTGQSSSFSLTGTGTCGNGGKTVSFAVSSGGYGFVLSPNPTTDDVTVTAVKDESAPEAKTIRDQDLRYQVFVYNSANILMRQGQDMKGQKQMKLNTRGLRPGVYFVLIQNGKHTSHQRLVVQ